jgi:hypothetical protein
MSDGTIRYETYYDPPQTDTEYYDEGRVHDIAAAHHYARYMDVASTALAVVLGNEHKARQDFDAFAEVHGRAFPGTIADSPAGGQIALATFKAKIKAFEEHLGPELGTEHRALRDAYIRANNFAWEHASSLGDRISVRFLQAEEDYSHSGYEIDRSAQLRALDLRDFGYLIPPEMRGEEPA